MSRMDANSILTANEYQACIRPVSLRDDEPMYIMSEVYPKHDSYKSDVRRGRNRSCHKTSTKEIAIHSMSVSTCIE